MDIVITLVKTEDRIIILKNGEIDNYWYLDQYYEELNQQQIDGLNSYLFKGKHWADEEDL